MGGAVGADQVDALLDELADARVDRVADGADFFEWLAGGSGMSQSSTTVGTKGQVAPQASVIAQWREAASPGPAAWGAGR
jgi:hypothetical protein